MGQRVYWIRYCTTMLFLIRSYYSDVIMGAIASQITSVSIVYSTFCPGADQRKHQSSVSLALVRGIHRWPVNSPHKGPVTRKIVPFDDVIMHEFLQKHSQQTSDNSPARAKFGVLFCIQNLIRQFHPGTKDDSEYGLSKWESTLQCNVVSRWLSPYPEWSSRGQFADNLNPTWTDVCHLIQPLLIGVSTSDDHYFFKLYGL